MKKISLFIIGLLFLFSIGVYAADDPNVDTVSANVDGTTINYSGTTVNGSTAVVCKLYDSNNEELKTYSTAVSNDSFSGSFQVTSNGDYTVTCANYEGGEKKSATATVTDSTNNDSNSNTNSNSNSSSNSSSNKNNSENPKTLDNISLFVVLFSMSALLVVGLLLAKKKYNN